MIARRLTLTTFVSLGALAGLLAFTATPAGALVTHNYLPGLSSKLNEGIPGEGPHGEKISLPGPLSLLPSGMTIDSGHLWLAEDTINETGSRIDELDAATGAFMAQIANSPSGEDGIAVGHAAGTTQVYAGGFSGGESAVLVFEENGTTKATWTGAATPAGTFGEKVGDVAVDDSSDPLDEDKGDVYVTVPTQKVIDIFRPEADGAEHYVGQITGPSSGETFVFPRKLVVDDANGDVVVVDSEVDVDVFEPAALGQYTLARQITETPHGPLKELYNLAVDSGNGDIYISEGFFPMLIDQFSSAGLYLGRTTGADAPLGKIDDAYSFAIDPASHYLYVADRGNGELDSPALDVFGPDVILPDVTTAPLSNLSPTSATLEGTVDPDSGGPATCRFEWGTSRSFGEIAPCEPEAVAESASPVPVSAILSGLQPDMTYYYRLRASNGNGTNPGEASQDQQFKTPGPGIHETSVTDLAATSVTFDASIDPNGAPAMYYFQYGTSTSYGSEVPAPPGEAIGSGEGDVDVAPRHIQGLQSGAVYDYRVVVISEPKSGEQLVFDGPDEVFTTQTAATSELPDGRQWEMVSTPDKKGAHINPIAETGVVQAAASGDALTYLTDGPTELEPQGNSNQVQVLAKRGSNGWESNDIVLPHSSDTGKSVGKGYEYRFFSENLASAVVQPFGSFVPGLSPEASESTAFLRTLTAGCAGSCYRPLVTGKAGYANVPGGTVFGEEPDGRCLLLFCGPEFIDATPDLGHIVLRSQAPLSAGAGSNQLYEWSAGKLALLSTLPGGAPTSGSNFDNAPGAISGDGSRVIWNGLTTSRALYLTNTDSGKSVQLDASEPTCTVEGKCKGGSGQLRLASADGSKVFFTDSERLDRDAARKESSSERQGLYECEIVETAGEPECELSYIAGEVLGVSGASRDASYLYFVADEALAPGASAGESNLYVRHDGVTKLIAILSSKDENDWVGSGGTSSSRVSPDGNWVEFMSDRLLTGYDNRDAISDQLDAEVYLYEASDARLVCASCNPTGARPTGAEYFKLEPGSGGLTGGPRAVWHGWVAANVPGWIQYKLSETEGVGEQPRYLSDSGRLFFNSGDALVPQDVNGTEDVYEYEPPGVGGCASSSSTFSERSKGCVGLISAGTSAEESGFLGASENGGDVLFLTLSKLQPQDYDNSLDVYDAHECTAASPCYPTPVPQPPACTTADACRTAPTPQPAVFGAPSSATFSGAGNVTPESHGAVAKKALTRAQKLAGALRACRRKRNKQRAVCERRSRTRYGAAKPHKAATAPKSRKTAKKKDDR